jgi:hypothetical protein
LLKASLPDIDRAGFVTESEESGHKICLTQLALFTSRPRVVPVLLRELARAQDASTLDKWREQHVEAEPALADAIGQIPSRAKVTIKEFRRWVPLTSRYVFHHAD